MRPGIAGVKGTLFPCFDRVYLTYLDRLARFGTRPLVEVLGVAGVEVKAVHVPEAQTYEQSLVADMIALVTSFAGKIHQRRKGWNAAGTTGNPLPTAGVIQN